MTSPLTVIAGSRYNASALVWASVALVNIRLSFGLAKKRSRYAGSSQVDEMLTYFQAAVRPR